SAPRGAGDAARTRRAGRRTSLSLHTRGADNPHRRYRQHMSEPSDAKRLLVVHHTTSPALQELLEALLDGTHADGIENVDVVVRPALGATVADVLAADGFALGTPANIGYMSGALKHFFDTVYYPTLTAKVGAPYGCYVHGNNDTAGAVRGIESIAAG